VEIRGLDMLAKLFRLIEEGLRGGCLGVGGGDATTCRDEFVLVSSSICCLFRF